MSSLESTIRTTKTLQDIELAEAMNRLKSNPSELRAWLQTQQDRVYQDIVKQKEDTFAKVYGDAQVHGNALVYDNAIVVTEHVFGTIRHS